MNGLEHINETFAGLRAQGRAALMPYFTLGYPTFNASLDVIQALAGSGADLIELGVPFSDPLADGPSGRRSYSPALDPDRARTRHDRAALPEKRGPTARARRAPAAAADGLR
jgi:tryptophan synthase alpha chain